MRTLTLLDPNFEDIRNETGEHLYRKSARNTFRILWQDWDFDLNQFKGLRLLNILFSLRHPLASFVHTIFIKKNPQFLAIIRDEIQILLTHLTEQLRELDVTTLSDEDKLRIEFTIHNILGIYVLFEPNPFETLTIPQLLGDEEKNLSWQGVECSITPLELSPESSRWKSYLEESDRLFSYGFTPITHCGQAHSILAHEGTTWDTAQGVRLQFLADLWPGKTPGEVFIKWQYEALNAWLKKQPNKTVTCGQSLGGSLAILTTLAFPDQILKAYPLAPPGLVNDYQNHSLFKKWFELPEGQRPVPMVQKQPGDLVVKVGQFPEGFEMFGLGLTGQNKEFKSLRPLTAHMRSYASNQQSTLKKYDINRENNKNSRKLFNRFLTRYGRYILFQLNLANFFWLTPIKQFFLRNKARTLLFIIGIAAILIFPPLASLVLTLPFLPHFSSLLLTSLLPSLLSATFISKSYELFKAVLHNEIKWSLKESVLNILTLGFYSDVKAFIKRRKDGAKSGNLPYPACEIHTHEYLKKAKDLKQDEPPSILLKLGLASLALVSSIIALPFVIVGVSLKALFWDLPRFCYSRFNKNNKIPPPTEEPVSQPKKSYGATLPLKKAHSWPSFHLTKEMDPPSPKIDSSPYENMGFK